MRSDKQKYDLGADHVDSEQVKRIVEIAASGLRIELLSPAEQVGAPGTQVAFHWRRYGAPNAPPGCRRGEIDRSSSMTRITGR